MSNTPRDLIRRGYAGLPIEEETKAKDAEKRRSPSALLHQGYAEAYRNPKAGDEAITVEITDARTKE